MNRVEKLYELIKEIYESEDKDDYEYLHWLVIHTERDHMYMLYQQLYKIYGVKGGNYNDEI